jgi:hypothetical protein
MADPTPEGLTRRCTSEWVAAADVRRRPRLRPRPLDGLVAGSGRVRGTGLDARPRLSRPQPPLRRGDLGSPTVRLGQTRLTPHKPARTTGDVSRPATHPHGRWAACLSALCPPTVTGPLEESASAPGPDMYTTASPSGTSFGHPGGLTPALGTVPTPEAPGRGGCAWVPPERQALKEPGDPYSSHPGTLPGGAQLFG